MASEQDDVVYMHIDDEESSETDEDQEENDDEVEDPEEEELNSPSTSSPAPLSTVNVPITPAPSTITPAAVTIALPATPAITIAAIPTGTDPERNRMTEIVQKPQIDESRRLFQRLWTDEDEIELLRGFLDYTTSNRGGGNSYHHDTAAFYEQIKSKLQLDFNKNQLVEKLRRLKKKYRNTLNKINSGKDISFKSPHDQATFEISRKIWSDTGKIIGFEDNVLDDDENHNHNHSYNINTTATSTSGNFNLAHCSNPNFAVKIEDGGERNNIGNSSSNRQKKRSRSKFGKIEEERRSAGDGYGADINNNENSGGGGGVGGGDVAATVNETLKSCLSPLLSEFMNGTAAAAEAMLIRGNPYGGSRGMGMALGPSILPPLPSHFPAFGFSGMLGLGNIGGHGHGGVGEGETVNEKWRKQQIMELEVYSRRLELVQDHIRLALAELRAMGGGGSG